MRKSQRIAIILLCAFWLVVFGGIAVFYLFYVATLFSSLAGVSKVAGFIGIIVFLYLICYSVAMQP